jgi:hypothetical protein
MSPHCEGERKVERGGPVGMLDRLDLMEGVRIEAATRQQPVDRLDPE